MSSTYLTFNATKRRKSALKSKYGHITRHDTKTDCKTVSRRRENITAAARQYVGMLSPLPVIKSGPVTPSAVLPSCHPVSRSRYADHFRNGLTCHGLPTTSRRNHPADHSPPIFQKIFRFDREGDKKSAFCAFCEIRKNPISALISANCA